MKKIIREFSILYLICIIFLISNFSSLNAQQVKWIKIGSLHSWFREDGCEPEVGRTFKQADQQDGLRWPAQYHTDTKMQDNAAAKGLWFALPNYTDADQYGANTFPFKVVHCGPRSWDMSREFIPVEKGFKLIGKFDHPKVYVDGIEASELKWDDILDEIDPTLPCDRMIYNVVNTSIGITMTRKIYAWSQQFHDNYFIYEYIFKNTGNVDKDEEIEQTDKTLENVHFFFQYRYAVSREGADGTDLNHPRWGKNALLSTRGEAKASDSFGDYVYTGDYEDWINGDTDADSLRCQYSWAGKHSQATYDLIGYPDVKKGTGRLQGPQFVGVVTLHVDRSAGDKSDDPRQPITTTYHDSNADPTQPNDQFDATKMINEWKWIVEGHRLPRHDEYVGDSFPDLLEKTEAGFSNMNGYGPYTLGPNDSIRIVLAEGVNGINRQLCESIGRDWIKKNSPYTLPDGSTTTDRDEFKKAWVYTGKDSLFRTFGRSRKNFNLNFDIPPPPPPPDLFEVKSGGDRISLSWSKNAQDWPGFAGYRIYRAIAKYDTTYSELFACGQGTDHPQVVNTYDDLTAQRGVRYFYYIISFDDGSTNITTANPGGSLRSSMFWTRTTEPAFLRRPAGKALDDIRIVPNPFNIKAKDMQFPGEPDKIMFLDIPAFCTIKIFTERGDHIQTIKHTNGSGDDSWNSTTKYGQVVVSGVYIAVFEVTADYPDPETGELLYNKGDKAVKKFLIIR